MICRLPLLSLRNAPVDDAENVPVEVVQFVLRAAVAGVASALRAGRRVARRQRYAGIVDLVGPAAGNDQGHRPVGARNDTVGARESRAWLDLPADRRVPLNDGQAVSTSATSHATARAPMILHFAGSSSREYSSCRGERSGCGSGHGVSPPPATARPRRRRRANRTRRPRCHRARPHQRSQHA